MAERIKADWIGLDWGTTNLRAYAMQGATVLARATSEDGMGKLAPDDFETAMVRLIEPWEPSRNTPIIACGMVGSRQGWIEAPYRNVPCLPLDAQLTRAPTQRDLSVHIISGLCQNNPADVMRGEETQIGGFQALNPNWDGIVCLPGTHTKWAQLSAGEVVSFQTFMTGEMYQLLGKSSVLRHSMAGDGWDDAAFDAAVSDALAKPEKLAARLFGLRAADLLEGRSAQVTRASLSGYLIGSELAAARPYWLGQNLAILGNGGQAQAYQKALEQQGVPVLSVDAERATLAGLTAAHRSIKVLSS